MGAVDGAVNELYLDAEEVDERRQQRAERFNTGTMPAFRLLGLTLVAVLVALHNRFVLGDSDWVEVGWFVWIAWSYCLISWAALRMLYRCAPELLPVFFLVVDVVVFTLAVYLSGANRSWLFPLVIAHVADQTATTFRRVLGFAHLGVFCYLGIVVIESFSPGASIDWPTELVKTAVIYAIGVYTSFTARTAERLRSRLVDTVRFSRNLVTELERSSRETQRALELSETASRSKSEFLANMSHELGTPLNSVIGFSDVLLKNRKGNLTDSDITYLTRIKDNGAHLLSIIGDILDLSRIEAGRLEVEIESVGIKGVVMEVFESLGTTARNPAVQLIAEVPDGLEPFRTDRLRLRQVLVNLIGNALKFTSEGSVRVRVVANGLKPRMIEVSDTGIGIPADRIAAVFRAFEQADNTTRRRYGGTGLGLSISQSLCELLGYRLEMESEEGKGSTFRIILH